VDRVTRLRFGQPVGHGAGKQLRFRVFKRVPGVPELTGGVKEFGIPAALGGTVLEVVQGAAGQRWPG
jgi:hypothetical protein